MRRLLTALAILVVVLVVGISALVLLVNPNDFRAYMVKKVEEKSGYQLALAGDLRWHVWPQLSILAGQMSLTAPGAAEPIVHADNMRLDVSLWPLLSHQLVVRQVMLKGAVIRLTPESEARPAAGAPQAPPQSVPAETQQNAWKFGIDSLKISDSLLVWQRGDNDQINVRDINLQLDQDDQRQAKLTFSSRVNRDQRDLALSLSAELALANYPHQIAVDISQFSYQLLGANLPAEGLQGQGALQASYQDNPPQISFSQLSLSANDNQLTGSGAMLLGAVPDFKLTLNADQINLDTLLGLASAADGHAAALDKKSPPVIAEMPGNRDAKLAQQLGSFNAKLALQVNALLYRGLTMGDVRLQADHQRGKLQLTALSGKIDSGTFAFNGSSFDASGDKPKITLLPQINQIELGPLWQVLSMSQTLTGKLSLQGELTGDRLSVDAFTRSWQGNLQMQMRSAQLHGFNIQQLIQQAVERSIGDVRGQERYERYTEVKQLRAAANLNHGSLRISELSGDSALLALTGGGLVNLLNQSCDMSLKVQVLGGWRGKDSVVRMLQGLSVPLRVYGPWNKLNYQLQVDQLLRNQLHQEIKRALGDRSKERESELKKLLNRF